MSSYFTPSISECTGKFGWLASRFFHPGVSQAAAFPGTSQLYSGEVFASGQEALGQYHRHHQ